MTHNFANGREQSIEDVLRTPYKLASAGASPPSSTMFSLLISSVVVAGGTYFLYRFYTDSNDQDEYPENKEDENAADDDDDDDDANGVKMRIFFGSQSGTAEGFAFDMEKEAKQYGFKAKALDLEEYDADDLQNETLVVFLVATYGEGEPTDNAQEFYTWLSSEDVRDTSELAQVQFAVFGLGNSQYEFFNQIGKKVDAYLEQWGATRLYARGEGDDDVGSIEDQFNEWKEQLWPLLCRQFLGIEDIGAMSSFECSVKVEVLPDDDEHSALAKSIEKPYDLSHYVNTANGERVNKNLFLPSRHKHYTSHIGICRMVQRTQLRQNLQDGSTVHIDFDLTSNPEYNAKNPVIAYQTADNMGVLVRNDMRMVHRMIKRLQLNGNSVVRLTPKDEKSTASYTFPEICTVRNLFAWFLDLNGSPGKKLLTTLARDFAKDAGDREQLLQMAENLQLEAANAYVTVLDIFERFSSIEMDLGSACELLKPLQPRLYTIASSSDVDPNQVSICVKLEQFKLLPPPDDEKEKKKSEFSLGQHQWNGVAGNFLTQAKIGNTFQFYMEDSKFKLPLDSKVPVIMIGVGAGLAPFAAFIDEGELNIQSKSAKTKKDYGEWWLFFGCRYKNGDYIYKEKMEKSLNDEDGVLDHLKCAFSRETKKKVYVQNLIEENGEELYDAIQNKKGRVYVCGGVAMGKAVRETFVKVFTFYHESKNGQTYMDNLLKNDIYVQELWG